MEIAANVALQKAKVGSDESISNLYLSFQIGKEVYAIEVQYITEIIGVQNITKVPKIASYLKGVINLRGLVIPLMDIRARFGLELHEYDERTCIVVVSIKDSSLGLIVDRVSEVQSIYEEQLQPPPELDGGRGHEYTKHMANTTDGVIIVLDLEKLTLS